MTVYIDIERDDYMRLIEALRYVIRREGKVIDSVLVEFITEAVDAVESHRENLEKADPQIEEITAVLQFLGGGSNG